MSLLRLSETSKVPMRPSNALVPIYWCLLETKGRNPWCLASRGRIHITLLVHSTHGAMPGPFHEAVHLALDPPVLTGSLREYVGEGWGVCVWGGGGYEVGGGGAISQVWGRVTAMVLTN